jgi:NitT/TauT family transport system substrate-binding protein
VLVLLARQAVANRKLSAAVQGGVDMGSGNRLFDQNNGIQAQTRRHWKRRDFVKGVAALAGAAGLSAYDIRPAAAEPPPEVTKLTLLENNITCLAPQYVANELLHAEGFSDVRYLKWPTETQNWAPEVFLSGEADLGLTFVPSDIVQIAAGAPVVILAGSHIGCVELIGGPRVKSARDLTGKKVAMQVPRSDEQIFVSMFAKYVGLNPNNIEFVVHQADHYPELLAEGKIDAFMGGPPASIELRRRKVGHV